MNYLKLLRPLQWVKENKELIYLSCLYLITSFTTLPFYRYISNVDAISYLSIAEKYLNGIFFDAINGVWGPLYSWLLIPFIYFIDDNFYAYFILQICIGLGVLILFYFLTKKVVSKKILRQIIGIISVPIIASIALFVTNPDLLVVFFLLSYIYIIIDKGFYKSNKKMLLLGLIGGFGYLTKHYFFFFFVSHVTLLFFYKYFVYKNNDSLPLKVVAGKFVLVMGMLALITLPWAGVLGHKYGGMPISTTGTYNHRLIGPVKITHPNLVQGLLPPPNSTAYSSWEDPSSLIKYMKPWNVFGSQEEFIHQLKLSIKNIWVLIISLTKFSILWLPILLFYLYKTKKTIKSTELNNEHWHYFSLTSFILLYPAGYVLMFIIDRYLLIIWLLLPLMAAKIICDMHKLKPFHKHQKIGSALVIIIFFSFLPLAVHRFNVNINKSKNEYLSSQQLKDLDIVGKRIASDGEYFTSLPIVAMTHSVYYGAPKKQTNYIEFLSELKKYQIEYFIIFRKDHPLEKELINYHEFVTSLETVQARVYKITY